MKFWKARQKRYGEIAKTAAGITKKFYFSYYAGKEKAIAYKLKDVVVYDTPQGAIRLWDQSSPAVVCISGLVQEPRCE